MGCLESISTGPSILRNYNEESSKSFTIVSQFLESSHNGDAIAQKVWNEAVDAIGFALTAYINILAPEIIILGGGVSKAGEDLLKPISDYLDSRLTFQRRPKIAIASLGDHAGMIGAGIFAARRIQ
jgi:glucokinase